MGWDFLNEININGNSMTSLRTGNLSYISFGLVFVFYFSISYLFILFCYVFSYYEKKRPFFPLFSAY